mgnify:CR=1 FL=1
MLLEKAVENYPESAGILVDLGKILNTLNESEKAKKIFKAALTIDPQNVYAQHGFGLACMRLQDYETALQYFLNATEQYYHYPLAHMHLGETLALMKDMEDAMFVQVDNDIFGVDWLDGFATEILDVKYDITNAREVAEKQTHLTTQQVSET